jgi:L-fuculose-phosphate aldolase
MRPPAPPGSRLRPDINAYLLRNHGAVCCGPDAPITLQRLIALESLAMEDLRNSIQARATANPSLRPFLQRLLGSFA